MLPSFENIQVILSENDSILVVSSALDVITHHSHQKYSVHNEGDKNYETLQVSQGYIRLC